MALKGHGAKAANTKEIWSGLVLRMCKKEEGGKMVRASMVSEGRGGMVLAHSLNKADFERRRQKIVE